MSEVRLAGPPSLSRMYARAAADAARLRITGTAQERKLPADRHVLPELRVELDRLTAFQRLMRMPVRDLLPSAYLHVLAFPVVMNVMTREDFPLPLLGMVHLRNEAELLLPVHFTDVLAVTAWAEGLRGHRSGTCVDLVAEVHAAGRAGPAPVWRGRSTYLAKGVFSGSGRAEDLSGRAEDADPGSETASGGAGAGRRYEPPVRTGVWRLGAATGRDYAAVSGDFNPIHLSGLSARALGRKQPMAHGMYLAARILADIGQPATLPAAWTIDFESPVYLPAEVAVSVADGAGADSNGSAAGSFRFEGWNPRNNRRHFRGTVDAAGTA